MTWTRPDSNWHERPLPRGLFPRARHPLSGALVGIALSLAILATPLQARTIILTDEDCEKMAFISAEVPTLGWACYEIATATFTTSVLECAPNKAFLIRYPIDRIPAGQKIVKAELGFTTTLQGAGAQRLHLRRIVGEWGVGVCWLYRSQRPKKVEWTQAGARGVSTDRATRPSSIIRSAAAGDKVVNVTEDVELWYTGATPNQGWMLTVEDQDGYIRLNSPLWPPGRSNWKLRITYEPE